MPALVGGDCVHYVAAVSPCLFDPRVSIDNGKEIEELTALRAAPGRRLGQSGSEWSSVRHTGRPGHLSLLSPCSRRDPHLYVSDSFAAPWETLGAAPWRRI